MRAVRWSFSMQSFAWLWAICGVCSRFGKSWIGVRKGEKVLHTMEMARPVVRRGRRKETTSCEFAGRFLVSHFTICIFCTCDVQKMRKRMYHAAAGSGIPYTPTITFLWRLWCVPAATSWNGRNSGRFTTDIPRAATFCAGSRATFVSFFLVFPVDLSRFARVLHPLLPCFSILRMHAGSCGCIWRRAGTYWRLRAVAAFTAEPTADATAETAMPASSARVAKTPGRRSWSRRVGPSTTRWSPMKTRASLWP